MFGYFLMRGCVLKHKKDLRRLRKICGTQVFETLAYLSFDLIVTKIVRIANNYGITLFTASL